MYEIFFINFWIIILCPGFVHEKLKNLKSKNFFSKNLGFSEFSKSSASRSGSRNSLKDS